MNRNHPYYQNQAIMPTLPVAPFEDQMIAGYTPRVISTVPMWKEFKDRMIKDKNDLFATNFVSPYNGYYVDDEFGTIRNISDDNKSHGGILAATIMDVDPDAIVHTAPATIINTEDAGLRYVQCSKDGSMMDMGPVESVCLVGNHNRPEGIYVPIYNTKAVADSIVILQEYFDQVTKDDVDIPPYEDAAMEAFVAPEVDFKYIAPPAELTEHHEHDNSHNGNCKCGGNCKCKKNKKKH